MWFVWAGLEDRRLRMSQSEPAASNILAFERARPSGCRILIVEDEMLISLGLIDVVAALGASSMVAPRAAKALALIAAEPFHAAIVDMNLAGEPADAVLDALSARGVPFIITTGYSAEAIAEKYRSLPMLPKPYMPEQVEAALLSVLAPAKLRARSV
jgi:DNA-binding NtrC family response regulator